MYEKFTDRARKVMQLANQQAQRFNHEYVGTEHQLLGLLKEGTGTGCAILSGFQVDYRSVSLQVEKLIHPGPHEITLGKLPMTPRAKAVLECAMEAAGSLGHKYVGTEHLLVGMTREVEGVAGQVLRLFYVTPERVIAAIQERDKQKQQPEKEPLTPNLSDMVMDVEVLNTAGMLLQVAGSFERARAALDSLEVALITYRK